MDILHLFVRMFVCFLTSVRECIDVCINRCACAFVALSLERYCGFCCSCMIAVLELGGGCVCS